MSLTEKQLYTLRHMLGINTPYDRIPKPYRNYACVNPGDPEFVELERLGAIVRYTPKAPTDYWWYTCTDEGKLAAMRSHKTIRKGRKQRVYRMYLHVSDAFPDLTFKEFLTLPDFEDTRRTA